MKRSIIIAAALAALAAPVAAQSPAEFAIQHFNQDVDQTFDVRRTDTVDNTVTVSSRGNAGLSKALDIVNGSAEVFTDIRGEYGVTVVSSTPAHGADIFEQIRLENIDNF